MDAALALGRADQGGTGVSAQLNQSIPDEAQGRLRQALSAETLARLLEEGAALSGEAAVHIALGDPHSRAAGRPCAVAMAVAGESGPG
jgi:hypothetical protein